MATSKETKELEERGIRLLNQLLIHSVILTIGCMNWMLIYGLNDWSGI